MAMNQETFDLQLKSLGDFFKFFTRKEIKHLPSVLQKNETIAAITSGFYNGNTWLITVTDSRILFLDKGMFFGLKQAEISVAHISAVTHKIGIIFGEIHVSSSAGTASIKQIEKRYVAAVVQAISNMINRKDNSGSTLISTSVPDQIERLGKLRDQGLLTEVEFQQQKSKILAA